MSILWENNMSKAFQIKNFSDYYITDTGNVYSRKIYYNNPNCRIKKLTPKKDKNGYLMIELWKDNKPHVKKLHRLVAETFIHNPENKKEINHKNGIKSDNRVENLEWSNRSENIKHAFRVLGRKPSKSMLGKFGKDNPRAKTVLQIDKNGIVAEFYGICDAERQTGINFQCISRCCLGRYKTAGGYKWRCKND
jgi:hypothetical protein